MARILLVEDNETIRDMLLERLAFRGHDVLSASDGIEGVAMAQSERPDVILMDMSLPALDGWQATQQLKTTAQTRSIPVIALTAHTVAGDRQKCLEVGCDAFVAKPIDFPRLLENIQALSQREIA
jgi:CheY-like chemotaxis protein